MIFTPTRLEGATLIDPDPTMDERGFFARTFCRDEFAKHGIHFTIVQSSISSNAKRGTLRGMHYQAAPHQEAKLVSCTMGRIYDVIIDVRQDSSTFLQWLAVELTVDNHRMLYIPEGFAHGFQTLEHNTCVSYHMSEPYHPASARGVRWNDPAFGIEWPDDERLISARDQSLPDWMP
jgi:dTDP-4-dehydrorhamnose 3,5-epimerase